MKKVVIFDLDGTLLNTLADLHKAVNAALEKNGYPSRSLKEVQSFIGNGVVKLMERAAPKELSFEAQEVLLLDFREYYKSHCIEETTVFQDMKETVDALSEKGFPLGVVSNKSHQETVLLIEKFFGNAFSFVLGSQDGIPRKPHPKGLETAVAFFNVSPKDAIYIGDSDVDVVTAKNAMIPFIGVLWGFRSREVLIQAGAEHLVESPKEILTYMEKCDE